MDLECDVYNQIQAIVSVALLPQVYEIWSMLKLYNGESVRCNNKPMLHNNKRITVVIHCLSRNSKQ